MHSDLTPRASDDPHDIVVVAPDAVMVAPSDDEELSSLLREAARHRSDAPGRAAPDSPAGPTVPPVDTKFRPAAVDVSGPSMARRLARGFAALLLAACIGSAAVAWKAYGDVALKQAAKLATQLVLITSMQRQEPASAAQPAPPADQADAANTALATQPAAEAAVPAAAVSSTDPAPSLQPTARDLASLAQQVEQLKASIEQLRTSQQQMSRDLAKVSEAKPSEMKSAEVKPSEARVPEQNLRPKIPAPPPRRVAARTSRPLPSYPPPQATIAPAPPPAAASYVPQAAAPYVPRQPDYAVRSPEPSLQNTGEALTDPELSSVPRPPMPVR
jgi:hypothetical protein